MVDYDSFLEIMQITSVSRPKSRASDTFKWEEEVIDKIWEYITSNWLTVEEAFKTFDKDFDGKISKEDLKWTIINVLKYDADTIQNTKLERLYKLLDFYKSGHIQLSDLHWVVDSANPYKTMSSITTNGSSQIFEWKQNAIQ